METLTSGSGDQSETRDSTLINFAAHRQTKRDRFGSVDDLLDRLSDNTLQVANGEDRAR